MIRTRSYDVGILGNSFCGLVSAVVLQRKGVKCVLLESSKEHSFDPSLAEFLSGFTIRPFLKRAGFHPTEVNAIPSLDVPIQVVHDRYRINFYGEEERFKQELLREFPLHHEHVLKLFKDSSGRVELFQHLFNSRVHMPPKGFFSKRQFFKSLESVCDPDALTFRKTSEELKKYHLEQSFSQVLKAIELTTTQLVCAKTTLARFSHLLTLLRWEGFHTEEGLLTLKKSMVQKFKEYGGTYMQYDTIQRLMSDTDRIRGMKFNQADLDEVLFNSFIVAGNPRSLTPWIEKARAQARWKSYIDTLPIMAMKVYQVYHIHPDGIPVGMKSRGILLPKDTDGQDRRALVRALKYTLHFSEQNNTYRLALTAFVRLGGRTPSPEDMGAQIRGRLEALMPFLSEYLVEEPMLPLIPNLGDKTADFREGFVYYSDNEPLFGVKGLDPETPISKTYLANEMILPGLGLDGETIAGLHVADLISQEMPKTSL